MIQAPFGAWVQLPSVIFYLNCFDRFEV